MIETIKSYLVSLGFSVDNASYQSATKALGGAEQGVAKFAGSAVTKFALAGAAVVSFVAASSIGIAKFIGDLAKADLANEKLARELWMSKDAATAYNATLKAMGVTLEDLYLSPELMRNFQTLNQEAKNLRPPQEFAEQMKLVRSVQFEFARMKLEATYALQWIGYYFMKYMEGPIKQIKQTLSDINGLIVKTMPSWTKVIAQVMSWFARMGVTTFRVFMDIIRVFNELGSAIPRNLKLIGAAVAALALIIQTGPVGIITASLLALILLLDDFYTYLDGGESQFGPFWKKLEDFYNKLKGTGIIDDFKQGWKDAFENISKGVEDAKREIGDFYQSLEDKGAVKNFEDSFKNTFSIISTLFDGAMIWVQDLFKELAKQGVLKDLKTGFEDVITSVSTLAVAVTAVVKDILAMKETEKTFKSIGDTLESTVILALKKISDLIKGIAEYINIIAKVISGGLLDFMKETGNDANKRLDGQPKSDKGVFRRTLDTAWDLLSGDFNTNTDVRDGFLRAMGLLAKSLRGKNNNVDGATSFNTPSYTLPTSNTQNNNNTQNTSSTTNLNQTNHIYGSDPQKTADAAQNNLDSMYLRSMSGVIR